MFTTPVAIPRHTVDQHSQHDIIQITPSGKCTAKDIVFPLVDTVVSGMFKNYDWIDTFEYIFTIENYHDSDINVSDAEIMRGFQKRFIDRKSEEFHNKIAPKFLNLFKSLKSEFQLEYYEFEDNDCLYIDDSSPHCEYIWSSYVDKTSNTKYFKVFLIVTSSCFDWYSDIDDDYRYGEHLEYVKALRQEVLDYCPYYCCPDDYDLIVHHFPLEFGDGSPFYIEGEGQVIINFEAISGSLRNNNNSKIFQKSILDAWKAINVPNAIPCINFDLEDAVTFPYHPETSECLTKRLINFLESQKEETFYLGSSLLNAWGDTTCPILTGNPANSPQPV